MTLQTSLLDESQWRARIYSGGWRDASEGSVNVTEPATGQTLTSVGIAGPKDVARAAELAAAAQLQWVSLPYEERAEILRRTARIFEENLDDFTTWVMREIGAVRHKAEREVRFSAAVLHQCAAMVTEAHGLVLPSNGGAISLARRVPHGVVGIISPFNAPLLLAMRAIAPALATGNTVVLKPDAQTPVSGGCLIANCFEAAGLPKDCLHVLPGDAETGSALCTDPNIQMISFTGSSTTGRRVASLASEHLKKVCLELGGKSALIVLEDADPETAASNARFGSWHHQGQVCMGTGRVLVHERKAAEVAECLSQQADRMAVGNPVDKGVVLGPIINERQLRRVHGIVEDTVAAGARLRTGGTFEHLFYRPTVLDGVRPGMRAFEEEIFGPVAPITTFSSDEEAIALANQTEYGLSAAIISPSVGRALSIASRLRAGLIHVNDQNVLDFPFVPFGGFGASGNGSRIGGPANWEEFTQWQWLTIKDQPPKYPL